MKIGLFFGSFNPVHTGHMIIANYMVTQTDLDQVWLVVSPQNPLKRKETLARDRERLYMVNLAVGDNPGLRVSDIEFGLPSPSYTVNTLVYLREKYPEHDFCLIMGGDNLATIDKWKNYEFLLEEYEIYLYSRPDYDSGKFVDHPHVRQFEAPQMEISSSYIRQCLKEGKSVQYLVPDKVYEYLESGHMYR